MNQAGAPGVLPVSLKSREEGMLSMGGWVFVGLAAISLGSSAAPVVVHTDALPPGVQLAQTYATPSSSYPQATRSAWDTYTLRLSILARQQGVRDATIRANVPGLTVNQRVIDMERTEPVARSSGGVVGVAGALSAAHVTSSLIRRGQSNYSDHYRALRAMEIEVRRRSGDPDGDLGP